MRQAAGVLAVVALSAGLGRAAESETRTFAVTVNGKPAGTFKMTAKADADTMTVTAAADVRVTIAVVTSTFTLRSTEVWKGDNLISLESTSTSDGKPAAVRASAANGSLTVNGQARPTGAGLLTTTGWRPPDPKATAAALLDTEYGTQTPVTVQPLGTAQVTVGGQTLTGPKYRLTGKGVDAEWWFDAAGRPVRQQMVWDGHKVVLTLTGITR